MTLALGINLQMRRAILACLLMVGAALLAHAMTPTRLEADAESKFSLESMLPQAFGDWRIDRSIVPLAPTPELKAVLDKTYDQTLSRTYIDSKGNRVMLSIAYGGKYGEGMQTHRPEICYPAQGFQLEGSATEVVHNGKDGPLRLTRLVASLGSRVEPITYWVVVGGRQTEFGFDMKLAQLRRTLTGTIPDGMLVRVSTLQRSAPDAYAIQLQYIDALLAAMSPTDRDRILGKRAS